MYSGDSLCQHPGVAPCRRKAYFEHAGVVLCGAHSRKHAPTRVALPKRPKAPFDLTSVREAARDNGTGQVVMQKMRMMKSVVQLPDFVCVFPNCRHAGRKDGIGMATLSPMRLGPVNHKQPGLPPAKNLENFWQGSKRFEGEDDDAAFHQSKIEWYLMETPQRHKIKGKPCLYWSWVNKDGTEVRMSRLRARLFYCTFYDELVRDKDEWRILKQMVQQETYNIQIVGYDARPVAPTKEAIWAEYNNEKASYGHELVLYTMLVLPECDWPWMSAPL
jgi:hypothetical protein